MGWKVYNTYISYQQVQQEINAAWQWTVHRRIGVFSADYDPVNPLAVSQDHPPTSSPPTVVPHDIWLEFLLRRFEVVKYYSREQVGITFFFTYQIRWSQLNVNEIEFCH